jgi:acyl-CoA synthetase (NDP forming)
MFQEHPLYPIMHPRSVAMVGASNDFSKMGSIQLMNLMAGKYSGKIYPIHPKEEAVFGLQAYRNARELPEAADLAILTIPTSAVTEVLRDLGERGVKRAIIISGGFKEVGEKGRELEAEILRIARQYNIRFLGPNCIGVIHPSFHLNPTMYPYLHKFGGVGVASQSGTYVTQILPFLAKMQIGLSQAFSVGNGADLDLVDCLEYLGEDPETKAIAVYIEGIKRPRDFIRIASRVSRNKPIVALYVGGTEAGARSAASHTASISGPDHLYDALFRQGGVIRAYSVEDLFEWAGALSLQPIPKGRSMAILTHSGGPASSLADACNRWALKVPIFSENIQSRIRKLLPATGSFRNPVDLTFFMDMGVMMEKLPQVILEDPEIDGLLIHGVMGSTFFRSLSENAQKWVKVPDYEQVKGFFLGTMDAFVKLPQKYGKPVIASSFVDRDDDAVKIAQDNGIPCFRAPERAVRAMAALCRYGEIQNRK